MKIHSEFHPTLKNKLFTDETYRIHIFQRIYHIHFHHSIPDTLLVIRFLFDNYAICGALPAKNDYG